MTVNSINSINKNLWGSLFTFLKFFDRAKFFINNYLIKTKINCKFQISYKSSKRIKIFFKLFYVKY